MAARDVSADLIAAIDGVLRATSAAPRIGVAVSGGGDSMALLLAGLGRAERTGCEILAATVDHGLRAASDAEARHVAAFCTAHGIPHRTLRAEGLADGPNLQARARDHRYRLLAAWARREVIGPVLLGHTSDDVAETLLMRLRRGVGLDGLAAMRAVREVEGVVFARPFLGIDRATLRAELVRHGVAWIEDPSNADDRFERAAVRGAMAALDLAPGMLARSAGHLDLAREALDASIRDLAALAFEEDRGDLKLHLPPHGSGDRLDRERLRRLLLLALDWIGKGGTPRRAEQERMLDASASPATPFTLAGCLISPLPDASGLRIAREAAACSPPVPFGTYDAEARRPLWDGRWRIEGPPVPNATIGALGADVRHTPWRGTGLPRASLMASPALRQGGRLLAAPLAGLSGPMNVRLEPTFAATLRPA